MSDKPFSMTCDAAKVFAGTPFPFIVATVSPQLPQASVRLQVKKGVWEEGVWILRTVTPTQLEIVNPGDGELGMYLAPLRINRQTKVAGFEFAGQSDTDPLTNCIFKTL